MGLIPHGDIVINVITTKETNEWEEKNESDKKYYAIYSNGIERAFTYCTQNALIEPSF